MNGLKNRSGSEENISQGRVSFSPFLDLSPCTANADLPLRCQASGLLYPVLFQVFEAVALYNRYSTLSQEELAIISETTSLITDLAEAQASSFRPLLLWLQAEAARSTGDKKRALALYDEAIEVAASSALLHLVAVLNERAAITLGSVKLASG